MLKKITTSFPSHPSIQDKDLFQTAYLQLKIAVYGEEQERWLRLVVEETVGCCTRVVLAHSTVWKN